MWGRFSLHNTIEEETEGEDLCADFHFAKIKWQDTQSVLAVFISCQKVNRLQLLLLSHSLEFFLLFLFLHFLLWRWWTLTWSLLKKTNYKEWHTDCKMLSIFFLIHSNVFHTFSMIVFSLLSFLVHLVSSYICPDFSLLFSGFLWSCFWY